MGFTQAGSTDSKVRTSELVTCATTVVLNVLTILVRIFQLQCEKIDIACTLDSVYLCPALSKAGQILRELPRTTEHDVKVLLEVLLEPQEKDEHRSAIKSLLQAASPQKAA